MLHILSRYALNACEGCTRFLCCADNIHTLACGTFGVDCDGPETALPPTPDGNALPAGYRDRAVMCTDFWSAYPAAVPEERHARAGKEAGLTCHVERFWCTVRQRCARLVRNTPSFSKCLRNHVGALWYFIRHYDASLW